MPVPFGFSVGDFLAVGDLARKIVIALDESRGATAEYKALCELLLSLNRSLHATSAIFFSSNKGGQGSSNQALLNGIAFELRCCKQLMDEFLKTSRKYTESLLNGNPGRRFKDEWRKITWSLYRTDDVKKLQANLQGHMTAFQMYTFAISWQDLAGTGQKLIKSLEENSEASKRIEHTVLEMFVFLKDLHDKMPKTLGYTWEGACTSDQKPIYLEDPLGRAVFMPLALCRNKDSFHEVLEIMSRGFPSHKRITQKEYEIVKDGEGAIIKNGDWESIVLPGVQIAISILIKYSTPHSRLGVKRCPRCNASYSSAKIIKSSLKCGICGLIFRAVDSDRIVELPEPPPSQAHPVHPHRQVTPQKAQEEASESKEQYAFRRVHFPWEELKYPPIDNLGRVPDPHQPQTDMGLGLGAPSPVAAQMLASPSQAPQAAESGGDSAGGSRWRMQTLSYQYLTASQLERLLLSLFGRGNFSAVLSGGEWALQVPRRITMDEICDAQEMY